METKIGIVKLKANTRDALYKMIDYTRANRDLFIEHARSKGYYWDSLFLDERPDGDYLIYVTKSPDWSKIETSDASPVNEWSETYLKWKDECWESETMLPHNDILKWGAPVHL